MVYTVGINDTYKHGQYERKPLQYSLSQMFHIYKFLSHKTAGRLVRLMGHNPSLQSTLSPYVTHMDQNVYVMAKCSWVFQGHEAKEQHETVKQEEPKESQTISLFLSRVFNKRQ